MLDPRLKVRMWNDSQEVMMSGNTQNNNTFAGQSPDFSDLAQTSSSSKSDPLKDNKPIDNLTLPSTVPIVSLGSEGPTSKLGPGAPHSADSVDGSGLDSSSSSTSSRDSGTVDLTSENMAAYNRSNPVAASPLRTPSQAPNVKASNNSDSGTRQSSLPTKAPLDNPPINTTSKTSPNLQTSSPPPRLASPTSWNSAISVDPNMASNSTIHFPYPGNSSISHGLAPNSTSDSVSPGSETMERNSQFNDIPSPHTQNDVTLTVVIPFLIVVVILIVTFLFLRFRRGGDLRSSISSWRAGIQDTEMGLDWGDFPRSPTKSEVRRDRASLMTSQKSHLAMLKEPRREDRNSLEISLPYFDFGRVEQLKIRPMTSLMVHMSGYQLRVTPSPPPAQHIEIEQVKPGKVLGIASKYMTPVEPSQVVIRPHLPSRLCHKPSQGSVQSPINSGYNRESAASSTTEYEIHHHVPNFKSVDPEPEILNPCPNSMVQLSDTLAATLNTN